MTTVTVTMSDLRAWLDKLGAMSPEDIRNLLQVEGIRGEIGMTRRCPIARLLQAKTGQRDVYVGISMCGYFVNSTVNGINMSGVEGYRTPHSVHDFMWNFDNHMYPELVSND